MILIAASFFRRWFFPVVILCLAASNGLAEAIRLAQDPALSPDGSVLAFAWRGDIWSVPVKGGTARRLTQHPALESTPAFSPDGKQIAFISDREGGRQAYVMPVDGGEPRQLTWHSEGFQIEEWFPDGQSLLVSVTRDHFWKHAERLARLEFTLRKAEQVLLDDYATEGSVSPDGKQVLFTREGEVWWRQGYQGSRAGQIWLLNREDGTCRQILAERTECRWPLWKPDGKGFYYVSSRDGIFNLWEHNLAGGKDQQRTRFKADSVVFPAISRDGRTIVFRHLFDFYRWRTGSDAAPEKIDIQDQSDPVKSPVDKVVLDRATDIAFTADGLQMAFVSGGDVWVMDTELREPQQVTRTPGEERDVIFAPDGKSLWFVSDVDGQADIWKATPEQPAKFWWENHNFTLTHVSNDAAAESRLRFTPDGKHLAYVKGRGDLWLADADGQDAKLLFESSNPPTFDFSPDGQWVVYSLSDEWFNNDIWLLPLDGSGKPFNLSRHPNNDEDPVWSPDGKLIAWTGKRQGTEVDIHYVWLRAEDDEQTRHERAVVRARKKMTRPGTKSGAIPPAGGTAVTPERSGVSGTAKKRSTVSPAARPKAGPVRLDLDDIHERIHRISIPNSTESGLVWSPDGKKLAFVATVDGKRGTYTVEFPENLRPRLLVTNAVSRARWLQRSDAIMGLSEGVPAAITSKGSVENYRFRAQQLAVRAERQRAIFDQCWRIMRDRYYDERLGNRDWNAVRAKYAEMAGAVPELRDLDDVVQLMLGELNGSHLGFRISASTSTNVDEAWAEEAVRVRRAATPAALSRNWLEETAHLGLRFDPAFAGPGWKVRDVLPKGPASRRQSRVESGEIILRVDGREVQPSTDVSEALNGPLERDINLRVKSSAGVERDVVLRPISYTTARGLIYNQWVKDNRKTVERLSDGALGYLHISAMSDESFQRFQEELYAAGAGKDGLVIDVRENGGGSTTDHLLTSLTQPRHAITVPRGGKPGYPQDRAVYATWNKPVVVMCNQNSFSNAEIFSHAIKTVNRGQLVGVPTAGGVLTVGSVRIMDVGTLRLPYRGWYELKTGQDMELNGAIPDHIIWPQPGDWPKGVDTQLQKAVEVLKSDVAARKQQPQPTLLKASERNAQPKAR